MSAKPFGQVAHELGQAVRETQQLHRMGAHLTSSRDRAHARIGFLLINHAHSLDPEGCRCPTSPAKEA